MRENEDGEADDRDERSDSRNAGSWYVGQRLAKPRVPAHTMQDSPQTRHNHTNFLGLQVFSLTFVLQNKIKKYM